MCFTLFSLQLWGGVGSELDCLRSGPGSPTQALWDREQGTYFL